MALADKTLDPLILEYAKREFLEKGYQNAKLRDIAKNAGVTTGAIYNRYKNKGELFSVLIKPATDLFQNVFDDAINRTDIALGENDPNSMMEQGVEYYVKWINVLYTNFDEIKLLVSCSSGSLYENFIDKYLDVLTDETMKFMYCISENNKKFNVLDREELHILLTAWLNCIIEPIKHDFTKEQALKFCITIDKLFNWKDIFDLEDYI